MNVAYRVFCKSGRKSTETDFSNIDNAQAFALLRLAQSEWVKITPVLVSDEVSK